MTREHEISATIACIDTEDDIIQFCWWCPATVHMLDVGMQEPNELDKYENRRKRTKTLTMDSPHRVLGHLPSQKMSTHPEPHTDTAD